MQTSVINKYTELIQIETISKDADYAKQECYTKEIIKLLQREYALIYAKCHVERIGPASILISWNGQEELKPTVLTAHYDTKEVCEEAWSEEPFSGKLIQNEIWGRGTMSGKTVMFSILESIEHHLNEGFRPKHNVYVCLYGDRETGGIGAKRVVEELTLRKIKPAYIITEGGMVTTELLSGLQQSVAAIGVGEKGKLDVKLSVKKNGNSDPVIPILAKAVVNCQQKQFTPYIAEPVPQLLTAITPAVKQPLKFLLNHQTVFGTFLATHLAEQRGLLKEQLRTTITFQRIEGDTNCTHSVQQEAAAYATVQMLSNNSIRDVREHLEKAIGDKRVQLEVSEGKNASTCSSSESEGYKKIQKAIAKTWHEAITVPFLSTSTPECRYFLRLCNQVYRFSGIGVSSEFLERAAGEDERIPLQALENCMEFYLQLVKRL